MKRNHSFGFARELVTGWDAVAIIIVIGLIVLLGSASRGLLEPLTNLNTTPVTLDPRHLPMYAARTTLRMFLALALSLTFTFTYATLAAKSPRAGKILVPILDILQSVPILGFISITVVFFMSLAPGRVLGAEFAAIFAIFTSQAWNMAFSFYQSLRMTPEDLSEASRSFRSSAWQRFWRLEVPFAMPGLVWNAMMSMAGGWFFVVASEAIAVGDFHIALPGVGSYVARAIEERNLGAIGWAIVAMTTAIIICDQLLFRPLVTWADRFRFEQSAAEVPSRSWVLELFRGSGWAMRVAGFLGGGLERAARARLALPRGFRTLPRLPGRLLDVAWLGLILLGAGILGWQLVRFADVSLHWKDYLEVASAGLLTLVRVVVLIVIASLIWVPIGVGIGLRPRLTAVIQPLAQFLAAFPANLLFPVAVFVIVHFGLAPKIWLTPLMILGTQWYILFNVIAGASAFPGDLREAATSLRVRRWRWWREVVLPGIFPYYVTGAITASGGSWNASIVSEAVSWGPTALSAGGLGAYIAQMTQRGDYARIALGIAMMSALVILMNRLLWRPLYALAERRTRLD